MVTLTGPGTILGGLPIWAKVTYGMDNFTGEGWAEVQEICWLKHNGKPGKPIPQKVWDRAEKYDRYFSRLTEEISEYNAITDKEP